jgi:hypothetical protein
MAEKKTHLFWDRNRKVAPFVVARCMAEYYFGKKDYDNATVEVEFLERLSPSDPESIWFRGALSALSGDKVGAERAISRLETEFKGGAVTDLVVGELRYFLCDMDAFFDAMFRALKNHSVDHVWLGIRLCLRKQGKIRDILN